MTSIRLTRAAFLGALVSIGAIIASPAHAARNPEAERYVQTNAQSAISSLARNGQGAQAHQVEFSRLMTQFADVPRIANFVLGRYGTQLRADASLRQEWQSVFQAYAIAVYEDQLDRFRGNEIRVTDSLERVPGRDVIVRSEITPNGRTRPMQVQWRILKSGAAWKVVDVSLVLEGNEIWLAQQQQRDFLAQLDRSNGNLRALMDTVRQQTASMRARISQRGA
jgi:phospholipid transport system substrate-binding protein